MISIRERRSLLIHVLRTCGALTPDFVELFWARGWSLSDLSQRFFKRGSVSRMANEVELPQSVRRQLGTEPLEVATEARKSSFEPLCVKVPPSARQDGTLLRRNQPIQVLDKRNRGFEALNNLDHFVRGLIVLQN